MGQAISCSVRNIHYRSTSLNHSFYHTCQILVVSTSCIFCIKLYILHIAFSILHGSYCTLNNFFAVRVKFIFNVTIARTNTCMYAFTFGIFQSLSSTVNVFFYSTCQCADSGPCHSLRNFYYRVKVSRTRNGKSCLNHVHAELFKLFCHLNFLYRVKLATWHLLSVAKCSVEYVKSVAHIMIFVFMILLMNLSLSSKNQEPHPCNLNAGVRSFFVLYDVCAVLHYIAPWHHAVDYIHNSHSRVPHVRKRNKLLSRK